MRQFEAKIIANREVAESWRELVLDWSGGEGPLPGQFLTLRVSPLRDPLLRRPLAFSGYADIGANRAAVVYQARGSATRLLAELAPGAGLDVIGPLGRPFPPLAAGEFPVLAGGGIGLGPLLFLASEMERLTGQAPIIALGFRSASSVPRLDLPRGAILCTDDGSLGFRGTPVDWLSRNAPSDRLRVYGCGPASMLAALAVLARERGWAASLSAEQWMACGVGACMGCALPRPGGGYLRACADGPVFDLGAIDWAAEAALAGPPRAAALGEGGAAGPGADRAGSGAAAGGRP